MANVWFSLYTTTLGGKNFIARYDEDAAISGSQVLKSIEIAVTGAVNVTIAPTHQRIDTFSIILNGNEQDIYDPDHSMLYDFGNYEDLLAYYHEVVVTFTDWEGTSKEMVFSGTTIQPIRLSPMKYPMTVQVQLMEHTV